MDMMMRLATVTTELAPVTGDNTPIGIYVVLLGTAFAAAICLTVLKRKKK